jgi:hypothetical protein
MRFPIVTGHPPAAFSSLQPSTESVFFFIVTRNDRRLSLGFTSIFTLLWHVLPEGYRCSYNIFFFEEPIPTAYDNDVNFLNSIRPSISVVLRNISSVGLSRRAGVCFPWNYPRQPGQIAQFRLALVRLFIPFLFDDDWFLYHDDDVIFRRGLIFPNVLTHTRNRSKVLFAVQDHWWVASAELRSRIHSYRANQDAYFGSGFLVMRNNEILHRELRRSIDYLANHMELTYIDQDALNLGFDWRHIELLPRQFCVTSSEHSQTWNWAFGFHFAGSHKHTSGFVMAVIKTYGEQRDEWVAMEGRYGDRFSNRSHVMPDGVVRVLNRSFRGR